MEIGEGRKLIIAVIAGVTTGLLLGRHAEVFESLGNVYFLATQAAIIPFMVSSLLLGLGKMDTGQALRLFKASWKVFCAVWALAAIVIFCLAISIPRPSSGNIVLQDNPEGLGRLAKTILELTIPTNPVAAIAKNQIPAIVLFCIAFGIALHVLPGKEKLLDIMKLVADGSSKFWDWLVAILPLALFAYSASLFGTLDIQRFPQVIYYLVIMVVTAVFLIFWLLPALTAALLDVPLSLVLRRQWKPLSIALITNSSPVALPASARIVRKYLGRRVSDPQLSDIVMTTLSFAFVFVRCGELLNHLFISFAAWFYHEQLPFLLNLALLPISLFSCIGGAGPVLISSLNSYGLPLQLPESSTLLYSQTLTVAEYPITLLSTLSTLTATLLATMNYYGLLRVNARRLLTTLGLGAVALIVLCVSFSTVGARLSAKKPDPIMQYRLDRRDTPEVRSTVIRPGETIPDSIRALQQLPPGMSTMERIERNGTLLVGYNPQAPPFCYFNSWGELVGYDVACMYGLADELKVNLVFIPFTWGQLDNDLKEHRLDIGCSAVFLTIPRVLQMLPSIPYFKSPVALFGPPDQLKRAREPGDVGALKVFNDPEFTSIASRLFPNAKQTLIGEYFPAPVLAPDELGFADLGDASALARANPGLAYMQLGSSTPVSYIFLMAPDSGVLARYVNYQILNWEEEGTAQPNYRYWILGEGLFTEKTRRWSILDPITGWLEGGRSVH